MRLNHLVAEAAGHQGSFEVPHRQTGSTPDDWIGVQFLKRDAKGKPSLIPKSEARDRWRVEKKIPSLELWGYCLTFTGLATSGGKVESKYAVGIAKVDKAWSWRSRVVAVEIWGRGGHRHVQYTASEGCTGRVCHWPRVTPLLAYDESASGQFPKTGYSDLEHPWSMFRHVQLHGCRSNNRVPS